MDESLDNTIASEPSTGPKGFQFRLVHLIYIVTLWSAYLATFQLDGIFPAFLATAFWVTVFSAKRPLFVLEAAVVVLCGLLVVAVVWPVGTYRSRPGRRAACQNNLSQISCALREYCDRHGSFPPAYIADEHGHPAHSWRVLILPYLEQESLFQAYRFDEPWNGPNNIQLLDHMPKVFACPSIAHGGRGHGNCTNYLAVVGPSTAWPGANSMTPATNKRPSSTVQLVECDGQDIPWLEPRDLSLDEALAVLTESDAEAAGNHSSTNFWYRYFGGRSIAMADRAVVFVPHGLSRENWSAMLSVDDGDAFDWRTIEDFQPPSRTAHIQYGNWIRLGIVVILTLWPLPWVAMWSREKM